MFCPCCGEKTNVIRTQKHGLDAVRRIRSCKICGFLFRTEERVLEVEERAEAATQDAISEKENTLMRHMAYVPTHFAQ